MSCQSVLLQAHSDLEGSDQPGIRGWVPGTASSQFTGTGVPEKHGALRGAHSLPAHVAVQASVN